MHRESHTLKKFPDVLFQNSSLFPEIFQERILTLAIFISNSDFSVTGNRTPVSRVTGGDTSHYTMTDYQRSKKGSRFLILSMHSVFCMNIHRTSIMKCSVGIMAKHDPQCRFFRYTLFMYCFFVFVFFETLQPQNQLQCKNEVFFAFTKYSYLNEFLSDFAFQGSAEKLL